jgi:hypothetical protein
MSRKDDEPIWINTEALLALRIPAQDLGLAMTLLMEVWWPSKKPFDFDPPALFKRLRKSVRSLSIEQIEQSRDGASKLFVVLPGGRWAPNPKLFTQNDPYDGEPPIRPVAPRKPKDPDA